MVTAAEPAAFDGARLLSWARRCVAELERRRAEINELNVFPVRDADTGSNMAHTMRAAVAEADASAAATSVHAVAEALAVGATRGARGNSGVVLSQVMRGVAQSVGEELNDGAVIAAALNSAVHFVDRAISEPVEGTVVTVLRAAAGAASDAVGGTMGSVARAAVAAARTALARTPSQLEVLREAGVVDAGGAGLVILLEELVKEIAADRPGAPHAHAPDSAGASTRVVAPGSSSPSRTEDFRAVGSAAGGAGAAAGTGSAVVQVESHAEGASHNLEVMFYFEGDLAHLEAELGRLGDSLVIARSSETAGTVHIHSLRAGEVIEKAFSRGAVTDLRLEVLPPEPVTSTPQRLIVALTPAGSLADLYAQAGAVTVEPGVDVVSDVLSVIRRSPAAEVILLPNGQLDSYQLSAVEKGAHAFEQTVTVLPTVRLVSGIAALAVHDPQQPLSTVSYAMSEAAGEMYTAAVQRAAVAGLVQEGAVSKGDVIVVTRGETVKAPSETAEAVAFACRRLLAHGGEQVSILYDPAELAEVDATALRAALGVDVHAYPADRLGAIAEIGVE